MNYDIKQMSREIAAHTTQAHIEELSKKFIWTNWRTIYSAAISISESDEVTATDAKKIGGIRKMWSYTMNKDYFDS